VAPPFAGVPGLASRATRRDRPHSRCAERCRSPFQGRLPASWFTRRNRWSGSLTRSSR